MVARFYTTRNFSGVALMSVANWAEFGTALVTFIGSHTVPARPGVRRRIIALFGERAYVATYALVSIGIFAWLISASGRAPFVQLWSFELWQLWVPNIAMPFACLLVAFGVKSNSPLSFGGSSRIGFDPATPGIAGVTRHPLLWAIILWSGSHMAPNGDLAHVMLFASFALFALMGTWAIDRRMKRKFGVQEWSRLARNTSNIPFAALVTLRRWPKFTTVEFPRLLAGALLYGAIIAFHQRVIGVSPLPLLQL